MPEPVEVNRLKLVLENFYDLLLGETAKLRGRGLQPRGGPHLVNHCHPYPLGSYASEPGLQMPWRH